MTKKQNTPVGATTDDFAMFDEEGHAVVETAKWSYPPVGYRPSEAKLFIDEEGVKNGSAVTMTMLAFRQSKYVKVAGTKERYNLYEKPKFMVGGKVVYHNQAIVGIGGSIFIFGSKRFTTNMFFANPPEGGSYHRTKFNVGLFPTIKAFIAKVKAEQGVNIPLYAVSFRVKPADKSIVVGTEETQDVFPLIFDPNFTKTSANEVDLYKELYVSEDLAGWKKEWAFATGAKAVEVPLTTQEAAQANDGLFGGADGEDEFDLAF